MSTKRCSKCGEVKSLSEFYKGSIKAHYKDGYRSECKLCGNRRSVKWGRTNPDRRREITREWQNSHRDRYRQLKANYRAAHLEELRADGRAQYHKNKSLWAAANARWYRENKPQAREIAHRRRARKKNQQVGKVNYLAILARDGHWCYLCQQPVAINEVSFDHVIPLSKGGPHSMENIKVTHYLCNVKKGTKPAPIGE